MKSKLLITIVCALSLFIYFILMAKQCNEDAADATNWRGRYDSLAKEMRVLRAKDGRAVYEQNVAVLADAKAVKSRSKDAFNLPKKEEKKIKEVPLYVEVEQKVAISNDSLLMDSSTAVITVDSSQYVKVPVSFIRDTGAYYMAGQVTATHVVVDSFAIFNNISLRMAVKKEGFFKQPLSVVQVVNSNRHIVNTGMQTLTVAPKQSAWSRWIKPAVAFGAGILISKIK